MNTTHADHCSVTHVSPGLRPPPKTVLLMVSIKGASYLLCVHMPIEDSGNPVVAISMNLQADGLAPREDADVSDVDPPVRLSGAGCATTNTMEAR